MIRFVVKQMYSFLVRIILKSSIIHWELHTWTRQGDYGINAFPRRLKSRRAFFLNTL